MVKNWQLSQQVLVGVIATLIATAVLTGAAFGWNWLRGKPWNQRLESVVTYGAFSADGNNFLFEEAGQISEANFYSSVRIVKVRTNKTSRAGVTIRTGRSLAEAREAALKEIGDNVLGAYGFASIVPQPFRPNGETLPDAKALDARRMRLMFNSREVAVKLVEKIAEPDPDCKGAERRMLSLTLTDLHQTVVIQNDDSIPLTRRCATSYQIAGAFTYADRMAVIIRVQGTRELEPRYRFIAATARIPTKNRQS